MKSGFVRIVLLILVFNSACNSSSTPPSGNNGAQPVVPDSTSTEMPASSETAISGSPVNLYNIKWVIGEMSGTEVQVSEGQQPHITFSQNDQRAQGNGGCNSFSASITTGTSGKLTITDVVSTRMACGSLNLESDFFKMLETVDAYSIEANVLSFFDAKKNLLARFKTGN